MNVQYCSKLRLSYCLCYKFCIVFYSLLAKEQSRRERIFQNLHLKLAFSSMSAINQSAQQQLQQDLQNELTVSNQLLRLISFELQQIKQFTNPGGELEAKLTQNATLLSTIANLQQIDIENLPIMQR